MTMDLSMLKRICICAALTLSGQAATSEEAVVSVTVDRAKVFRIDEPASTVIVGNPFIADVSMHDRYTVVVTGKAYGSTNLVILDDANKPIIDEVIIVKASGENTVSVTRNAARTTYSCAPVCEPTLRMGDSEDAFASAAQQSTMRNDLAVQAAGGSN
ncbi:pilus assembly protein N-terminal domain-containing protein [Labrenzia sp. CE80]|uniref:pilus assembly protein N-terminal domain-containing protein n=1 Tax=Labrenzia sp. CE80 TaxID=1788986 RepID=UPI001930F472|nr:pilus assembly protein N-terminal domain-containing protein [Labrenzia sp. CE80]